MCKNIGKQSNFKVKIHEFFITEKQFGAKIIFKYFEVNLMD